jgi:hypothetical protein
MLNVSTYNSNVNQENHIFDDILDALDDLNQKKPSKPPQFKNSDYTRFDNMLEGHIILNQRISPKMARMIFIVFDHLRFLNAPSCSISQHTLAEKTGCTIRSIKNYIRILTEAGLFQVEREPSTLEKGKRQYHINTYKPDFDLFFEMFQSKCFGSNSRLYNFIKPLLKYVSEATLKACNYVKKCVKSVKNNPEIVRDSAASDGIHQGKNFPLYKALEREKERDVLSGSGDIPSVVSETGVPSTPDSIANIGSYIKQKINDLMAPLPFGAGGALHRGEHKPSLSCQERGLMTDQLYEPLTFKWDPHRPMPIIWREQLEETRIPQDEHADMWEKFINHYCYGALQGKKATPNEWKDLWTRFLTRKEKSLDIPDPSEPPFVEEIKSEPLRPISELAKVVSERFGKDYYRSYIVAMNGVLSVNPNPVYGHKYSLTFPKQHTYVPQLLRNSPEYHDILKDLEIQIVQ